MKERNEPPLTELIRYAEMTWRNVQHSESLRNVLLSIYLTIGAGFIAILSVLGEDTGQTEEQIAVGAAITVNLVGVLFNWVFLRFQRMISRDLAIVGYVDSQLKADASFEPVGNIWKLYRKHSAGVLLGFPVTYAFAATVGAAGSGLLAVTALRVLDGNVVPSIVAAGGVLGHLVLFITMKRLMPGIKYATAPQSGPRTREEGERDPVGGGAA